jgi:DNA adenine methylase
MSKLLKKQKTKPFLKWAGGKRQLLSQYDEYFPKDFNTFFEPFVGGGAVFFHFLPKKAHLNDVNKDLINAYKAIKNDLGELTTILKELEEDYLDKGKVARKKFFYSMRDRYNSLEKGDVERTALLFFLNKTCFNGMYRVNNSGGFNVPHGRYKNPTILDEKTLESVSSSLRNTKLTSVDFKKAVKNAKKGDFVYFDPPYDPVKKDSFTDYSKNGFDKEDQIRLRDTFAELDKKGCLVMLSNSYTDFIKDIYGEYRIETVQAGRSINSDADGRGKVKEVVILNY